MNDAENTKEIPRNSGSSERDKDSGKVHIQPSETDSEGEDNAPGRTPGKAEGSREIVEEDLRDKKN